MPTVEQIRLTIVKAMEQAGEGPVAASVDLKLERNYLSDFLNGKKQSIKTEVTLALAERYGIPLRDLVVGKEKEIRRRSA